LPNFKSLGLLRKISIKIEEFFPKFFQIFSELPNLTFIFKPNRNKFSLFYDENKWGSKETHSGIGSTLKRTKVIREKLPLLIKDLNTNSLLDIPCGDFNWLSAIKLNIEKYIGGDIVPELIAQNKLLYGKNNKEFKVLDMIFNKLPQVDLILCRDGLEHLSFKDIKKSIKNFKKSKSKYLLCTTFPNWEKNRNIFTGGWRPLNLQKKPINFPKPYKVIIEEYVNYNFKIICKCLALWRLDEIRI